MSLLICLLLIALLIVPVYGADNTVRRGHFGLYIAASDAPAREKQAADIVCTGKEDELAFRRAVSLLPAGGELCLSHGNFWFDSFEKNTDGICRCLTVPSNVKGYRLRIGGQGLGGYDAGTGIHLSPGAYDSLKPDIKYEIIGGAYYDSFRGTHTNCLELNNLDIILPDNQKPITCINGRNIGRMEMDNVTVKGFENSDNLQPAAPGCIGISLLTGSNYGQQNTYRGCGGFGFYEAFRLGSEHVVMINCSGIFNVYSYTFGNYEWSGAFLHPITLINCCDERGINFPRFVKSGYVGDPGAEPTVSRQNIDLIDFNLERYDKLTPGGKVGNLAVVENEDYFGGTVTFTMLKHAEGIKNNVSTPFFEKGNGKHFRVRNIAHKLSGTSQERRTYAGNNMQEYFDTDLNKLLYYVNDRWIDAMGNVCP